MTDNDISDQVSEILRRLDLEPTMVQSIEIFPDRVYVTEYADPKRLEDGEPVLHRFSLWPIIAVAAEREPA